MKYLKYILPLLFCSTLVYGGTPIDNSTPVNMTLTSALDIQGKWKRFFISPGQENQIRSDLGVASSDSPTFTGTVTATAFSGSGAGITDANNLRLTLSGTTTVFGRPVSMMWIDYTGSQTAQRTVAGTTTRKTLYSQVIPGGAMGTSGVLEIGYIISGKVSGNTQNTIILLGNGTISTTGMGLGGANATMQNLVIVANRGSTTSQVTRDLASTNYAYAAANIAVNIISVDTGTDTTLSLSVANNIATASTTLEGIHVKLLSP